MEYNIRPRHSHSNSLGNNAEKDTAGCRALNRKSIVIGVKIVEAEVCPDHIHMLVEIPPKMSVAGYIGFLKGKSSLMIFQRHGNLKYKYGNRSFWCRGYYVDTAGKNTKKIAEYIQNQLKEDQLTDQMTLKEYMDPLAGNK